MKKTIFTTLFFLYVFVAHTQISITPYFGFPNSLKFWEIQFDSNYINEIPEKPFNENLNKFGPFGISLAYTSKNENTSSDGKKSLIGFSLDINYSSCDYSFNYINDSVNNTEYEMESSISILRVMLNLSYHYGNSLKFDPYLSGALGLRYPVIDFKSTNPNFIFEKPEFFWEVGSGIPFSFRLAAGFSYYFTKNIGLNLEAGIGGGGLIRTGVSYRFL